VTSELRVVCCVRRVRLISDVDVRLLLLVQVRAGRRAWTSSGCCGRNNRISSVFATGCTPFYQTRPESVCVVSVFVSDLRLNLLFNHRIINAGESPLQMSFLVSDRRF